MSRTKGRFSEAVMTKAMQHIADHLQIRAGDAQLLRLTNNAVFALPSAGLVIRINRSHSLHERVYKVVQLAQWFEQINAPTILLLSALEQPLRVGDLLATVWHYVTPAIRRPTATDLGQCCVSFTAKTRHRSQCRSGIR